MRKRAFAKLNCANIDIDRYRRCGFEEVVYCPGKSIAQLETICDFFLRSKRPLFLTRIEKHIYEKLKKSFPLLKYNTLARAAFFPQKTKLKFKSNRHILIVSAGTADIPVAEEAFVTLNVLGVKARKLYDVGVAGIKRLLVNQPKLRCASCIIVVAGMDAALASVVSGLVKSPVIAVPTSCGYGAHFDGLASLLSMLNTCAAGIGVVNIDNGFGAGILAYKILSAK
jgi:NCAIR mutase (PurE)-related protein